MKHVCSKAANMPEGAGFCCHCHGTEETHFDQRRQTCLSKQDFAATAMGPKKLILLKGSKNASGSWNLLLHPKYFFPLLR